MIILPLNRLNDFYDFLEHALGGVQLIAQERPKRGEYARFLYNGSWCFVASPTSPDIDDKVAHVYSSDKKLLEEIQVSWSQMLMIQCQREMKDAGAAETRAEHTGSSPGVHEG